MEAALRRRPPRGGRRYLITSSAMGRALEYEILSCLSAISRQVLDYSHQLQEACRELAPQI